MSLSSDGMRGVHEKGGGVARRGIVNLTRLVGHTKGVNNT